MRVGLKLIFSMTSLLFLCAIMACNLPATMALLRVLTWGDSGTLFLSCPACGLGLAWVVPPRAPRTLSSLHPRILPVRVTLPPVRVCMSMLYTVRSLDLSVLVGVA